MTTATLVCEVSLETAVHSVGDAAEAHKDCPEAIATPNTRVPLLTTTGSQNGIKEPYCIGDNGNYDASCGRLWDIMYEGGDSSTNGRSPNLRNRRFDVEEQDRPTAV
jgi:hypothetical protein